MRPRALRVVLWSAATLAATARGFAEGRARSARLKARIEELEATRSTLETLGDREGVAAIGAQIELEQRALAENESNLDEVIRALKAL